MKRLSLPVICLAVLSAVSWAFRPDEKAPGQPETPSRYSTLVEAKNPIAMHCTVGDREIVGWIGGARSFEGQRVATGPNGRTYAVDRENVFRIPLVDLTGGSVTVSLHLNHPENQVPKYLAETVKLPALAHEESNSAFFVVDRTAYRPGQTLYFAGFLRKMTAGGDFEPLPNQTVDVDLVSAQKGTRAARLKLTGDSFGRIAGSYAFSSADALDDYTLAIAGWNGSARLVLGEYRKSKISLKIKGEIERDQVAFEFKTVDFLDRPVAAQKLNYTLQVIKPAREPKPTALNAAEFAVPDKPFPQFFNLDGLTDDARDLCIAYGTFPMGVDTASHTVYSESKSLILSGTDPGRATLKLKGEWRDSGYRVAVQAVVTDANGREQRATFGKGLSEIREGKASAILATARELYETGEAISVGFRNEDGTPLKQVPSAALVVMKLAGAVVQPLDLRMNHIWTGNQRVDPVGSQPPPMPEFIKQTLVTAAPMVDGKAEVKLTGPGAYKFVAVEADGTRNETNVVVREPKELPALQWEMPAREWNAGEKLRATLHGRYTNARVLILLEDIRGVRWHKTVTLDAKGHAKLEETLPPGLNYGCTLQAVYRDTPKSIDVASAAVRINPIDRQIKVSIKTADVAKPGEPVDVDIEVDRREEVDLVVSVYDQSLLGIRPDKSTDIKNFYLADERALRIEALRYLEHKIGRITVYQALRKIDERCKRDVVFAKSPEGQRLQALANTVQLNNAFSVDELIAFLQFLNVGAMGPPFSQLGRRLRVHSDAGYSLADPALIDIIGVPPSGSIGLAVRLIGDRLMIAESSTNFNRAAGMYWNYFGVQNGGGFGGGFQGLPNGFTGTSGSINGNGNNAFGFGTQGGFTLNSPRPGGRIADGNIVPGLSGNSAYGFTPEGQGAFSMLPPGALQAVNTALLLDADPGEAHIDIRRDFSDSAFWKADLRTDAQGKARVSFKVPDSLTGWQIAVKAISSKMHVGSAKANFRTSKPIMVWPMLPRHFVEGDRVALFGTVHNRTAQKREIRAKLKVENGEVLDEVEKVVTVAAGQSAEVYWNFKALKPGFTQLMMSADCAAGSDASLKRLPVHRAAVEEFITASGQVKKEVVFEVPAGIDRENAQFELSFAPSLAADMADTLNYLVEYPYGCVEQTMSRFLPAIKVAQILKQYQIDNRELNGKLPGVIAAGIKRLLELQQADGGWGWYGGSQTHEMMTPYALYGLLQAEKAGYAIPNEQAVERGLQRLAKFFYSMQNGGANTADTVYCLYVYSHRNALAVEMWDFIKRASADPQLSDYATALALEICVQQKQPELTAAFAKRLREKADRSHPGWITWKTAGFSRWGDNPFEITAVALKALVAFDRDDPLIDGILAYFAATKRGDRWNSTKDTAMILYAMCDYLVKADRAPDAKNALSFRINGGKPAEVAFEDKMTKKIVVTGQSLQIGRNTIAFEAPAAGVMYRLVLRYWKSGAEIAAADRGITVRRSVYLVDEKTKALKALQSGDTVPKGSYLMTEVTALSPQNLKYLLVESPKPATAEFVPVDDPRFAELQPNTGYALREDRLGSTAYHHENAGPEIRNRAVMLAELAGDFTIPPACAEMMYQTEVRGSSPAFRLTVK